MRNKRNNLGFTMAELLIVVAIITVLGGVGFIAVQNYQRGLALLERDAIAKEIFVAAQNHLTMADSQGYMGLDAENIAPLGDGTHLVQFDGGTAAGDEAKMLDMLLPFGAVDETVRAGGRYYIHYQTNPAWVLDVFYWTPSGRFGGGDAAYTELYANREDKGWRKRHNPVIGWYGGDEGLDEGETIATPAITVKNAERLTATVNYEIKDKVLVKLIVTGVDSGAQAAFDLTGLPHGRLSSDGKDTYTVILDDVTQPNMHFADISGDASIDHQGTFFPGENVIVKAVAYSNTLLTNIAYSNEVTVNSLFADIDDGQETAMIGNFRHLENLDETVSGVVHDGDAVKITKAKQLYDLSAPADTAEETPGEVDLDLGGDDEETPADLSWPGFVSAIGGTVKVYGLEDETGTAEGCYRPVSPACALTYDGQGHSVSGVVVKASGDAGLFGTLTQGSLSNIELIDFDITGASSAGALAGSLTNTAVTNVLAHSADKTVTASEGPAGGLIGSVSSGTVSKCAAAMIVSGTDAGGLIGSASNSAGVTASYSGGHTNKAAYYNDDGTPIINVTATDSAGGLIGDADNAGGLIGDAGDAAVRQSYSTCSVKGANAGGLVGAGGTACSVSDCYAAGLVTGASEGSELGALAGHFTGRTNNCQYFGIINENMPSGVISGASELDGNVSSYDTFVGDPKDWGDAKVYDPTLTAYYQDKYNLKTVAQLGTALVEGDFVKVHYGDWPAPELFVVNTAE